MFTYCFIDNLGLKTPTDFAFDRDYNYLQSRVEAGEFKALIILSRIF